MIDINDIKKIIESAKAKGHDVIVRDIFYVVTARDIKENKMIYAGLFGHDVDDKDVEEYDKSEKIKFLKKYIERNFFKKTYDISFEENKAYMLELKDRTEKEMIAGTIKKDKAIEILSKLSIALNDKFAVGEKSEEQRVVVKVAYNDICPYCRHEIHRKTDEDMLAEIKEKYNLIPKDTNERENESEN